MNAAEFLAQQPVIHSIGWTLIHFLWQGAALAGLFAVVMHALRNRSANARYLVGVTTLLLMAVAPVVTLLLVQGAQPWLVAPADLSAGWSFGAVADAADSGFAATSAAVMPWLVVAWFAGVLALAVRLCAGWWRIQGLRHNGVRPAPSWVAEMVARVAVELRVPVQVQVLMSVLIDAPTVIGWLRPVILLPASVVTGLSPQQLEMVIAHELGHVRRFDYLVNLIQVMIGTLLFYHPAVAWVSDRVRIERENCCDDIVIARTTNPVAYARALAALEAGRGDRVAGLAMAATGGSLLGRIRRMAPELSLAALRDASIDDPDFAPIEITDRGLDRDMQRAAATIHAPMRMPAPEIRVAAKLALPVAPRPATTPVADTPPKPDAEIESAADPETAPGDTASNGNTVMPQVGLIVRRLPEAVHTPAPEYPITAARRGIAGAVTASYMVMADGSVAEIEILGEVGGDIFGEEVARTLSSWRFQPPADGYAVGAVQTFRFNPNDQETAARECAVTGSRLCRQRRAWVTADQRQNLTVISGNVSSSATRSTMIVP
ncbi:MAG: TonB family protein [Xanthomonadaceae bacterium]|nr:TonB family protein [Xanthomonadaceae bacterium]